MRLRILNAANSRVMTVELPDVSAWICAKDGQPLAQPYILQDSLTLAPAERYDLIVDIPVDWQGEKPIYEVSTKQRFAGAYWEVSASAEVITRNPPAHLPENPLIPLSDEKPAHSVQLMMEGGVRDNSSVQTRLWASARQNDELNQSPLISIC